VIKADDNVVTNVEYYNDKITLYSFKSEIDVKNHLKTLGITVEKLTEIPMSLEEAFIGLTGKY
jgi:ABC-2 type transport system ATP-binding protein